jgi:CRP-like cAMP-binding protein
MKTGFAFTKFADRLNSILPLPAEALDLLADMPSTIRDFGSHHELRHHDDGQSDCCLLLQGYLCWKDADRANDQIISVHVPGDIPDLYTVLSSRTEGRLCSLGPATVAFVPHSFFRRIGMRSEAMARALSLLTLAETSRLRNWLVVLGSSDSCARVAHLICDIAVRLRAVGLARDHQFTSPFTQSDLADVCGISSVHANRTIQDLRRRGLLQWQSRTIKIIDWAGLARLARFNPEYLRLHQPAHREPNNHPSRVTEGAEPALSLPMF